MSRNGCIVEAIEKAYATWLTKPNQARTSVMFLGVGKPVMASRYFCDGLTSDGVMVNPANSTSKRNLRGFSVIPFSAQCVTILWSGGMLLQWTRSKGGHRRYTAFFGQCEIRSHRTVPCRCPLRRCSPVGQSSSGICPRGL